MLKVPKTSTEWPDHIVLTITMISMEAEHKINEGLPYAEFTKIPRIDVESKEGRIEKRPLQVAGALTLPAAMSCQSIDEFSWRYIQSPAIE